MYKSIANLLGVYFRLVTASNIWIKSWKHIIEDCYIPLMWVSIRPPRSLICKVCLGLIKEENNGFFFLFFTI